MDYLKIDNAKDLKEITRSIKAEKNLGTLISVYEDFLKNFSCKPDRDKFPYPKVGSIIDEEKSVKWNKKEVERQRNVYFTKLQEINQSRNFVIVNLRDQLAKVLAKENQLTIDESKELFTYAFNIDYNNGVRAVVNTYKDLAKMYKNLLNIHDNKKKPVIHTSKIEADDIDKVIEELKENSSNFQKSYKRDNNMKFHKTYKAIQLNKAIEIVKTVNKDRDYISENAKEEYER